MPSYYVENTKISIDDDLEDSQPIYRIVDFFGAALMLESKKLMLPSPNEFSDINEGIGVALSALMGSWPFSGCSFSLSSQEDYKNSIKDFRANTYISCWTSNPESVALWSLYSPDFCSVRIETTIGDLKKTLEDMATNFNLGNPSALKENETGYFCSEIVITRAKYRDIKCLYRKIKIKVLARKRLAERYLRQGKETKAFAEVKNSKKPKDYRVDGLGILDLIHVKDLSFSHECEIRAHTLINKYSQDNKLPIYGDNNNFRTTKLSAVDRLFIPLTQEFIKSVTVDPRAPLYKKNFIEEYFKNKNINISKSRTFTEKIDLIDIFPTMINPDFI